MAYTTPQVKTTALIDTFLNSKSGEWKGLSYLIPDVAKRAVQVQSNKAKGWLE